jgi:hypothetical protein
VEEHRSTVKQILVENPKLRMVLVDLEAEIAIFEMFKAQQISR